MNIIQRLRKKDRSGLDFELMYGATYAKKHCCMICLETMNITPFYETTYHRESNFGNNFIYKIHKPCGELPGEFNHSQHSLKLHPLSIHTFTDYVCDICFTFSPCFKYRCKTCHVRICQLCVSKHVDGQQVNQRVVKTFQFHKHNLLRLYFPITQNIEHPFSKLVCCICLHKVHSSGYACVQCKCLFHESCMTSIVSKNLKSWIHPQHVLSYESIVTRYNKCVVCGDYILGVQLRCTSCNPHRSSSYFTYHAVCGKRTVPGLVVNKEITLFYFDEGTESDTCRVCGGWVYECHNYRDINNSVRFHIECLLPPVVDHPCHWHELKLTSCIERKNDAEKYRCDVCEEEEDFEHYVYHCEGCYFTAHIECIFIQEEKPLLVDYEHKSTPNLIMSESLEEEMITEIDGEEEKCEESEQMSEEVKKIKIDEEEEYEEQERISDEVETTQDYDFKSFSLSKLMEEMTSIKEEIGKLTTRLHLIENWYAKKSSENQS